jgi:hypothetical protein
MNCTNDKVVDHINGNKLDNRKSNLRICTQQDNCRNRCVQSNNKSGYKGVSFNKEKQKYEACICIDKKTIHLGLFNSAIDAAIAYKNSETKLFGKFGYYSRQVR